ncbi:MAG: twin-arginine translocase TatA/TatE family subunit [Magnetococcales bacterium]|nr:twin-arginine translocase TatA/TatE family subunit [Magnetococcales bacterium]
MFELAWSEILIIALVALLALGPEKLPEVARVLGRTVRQARRLMHEVQNTIRLEDLEMPDAPRPASPPPPTSPAGASVGKAGPSEDPPPPVLASFGTPTAAEPTPPPTAEPAPIPAGTVAPEGDPNPAPRLP